jgi:hypothetical protein
MSPDCSGVWITGSAYVIRLRFEEAVMSNVVKLPYDACRRVHSKKPRRSKNGSPEERAAKTAAA